jgi:CubicO group peptidase (beta-lactamase class C family)
MNLFANLLSQLPVAQVAGAGGAPWGALRQRLDHWVASGRVAGLQHLVALAGQRVFEHHAGVADAANGQPVNEDTLFNLYSITKPLTATLVLRLAEQGRLSLDDPIARATGLPQLAAFGTVRDTLLHRAGFANPMPLRWSHRVADDAGFNEADFVHAQLAAASRRGRVAPHYSNVGYLALGLAAERATGLGFREALHRHLMDALSLGPSEHLSFIPAPGATWARGHLRRFGLLNAALGALVHRPEVVAGTAGRWVLLHRHHVNGSAYGGLIGNARGLARFGQAVLGQGVALEEPLRQSVCAPALGPGEPRTLGWFSGRLAGHPWCGHAGGGLGAYGELRLYPQLGAVSVLLTNRPGLRDARALDGLDALWLPPTGRP